MDIRPIKSGSDYQSVLARIEELIDAEFDSPAGDELDVLTTLVEAYEAQHFPIDPADPVEAIIFRMEQQRLERKDLEPFRKTPSLHRMTPRQTRSWRNGGSHNRAFRGRCKYPRILRGTHVFATGAVPGSTLLLMSHSALS